jgi:hypothetical protein
MTDPRLGYHWICITFEDQKLYRHFAFLPRKGSFLKLAIPDEGWVSLKVDSVWFSDSEEDDFACQPALHCSRIGRRLDSIPRT